MALSGGDNWSNEAGGIIILTNSTFELSKADRETGGVIYGNEFTTVDITGDGNNFVNNECGADGGVVAASTNTRVVVEGGNFTDNFAEVRRGTARRTQSTRLEAEVGGEKQCIVAQTRILTFYLQHDKHDT